MDYCQASLVALDTFLGWPLRIATVARQVFLCVENGATNWQPLRGLRPESALSESAVSSRHLFLIAQSASPPVLDRPRPTSKAAIGQALARHYQRFRRSPCFRPVHAPSP